MKTISSKMLLYLSILMSSPLLCDYSTADLMKINDKMNPDTKKTIIKVITPDNLTTLAPEVINHILDNDTKDLPLTKHILESITPKNFNSLKPIIIYKLVQKGGKDTSAHIVKIFKESPSLFIYVNPNLLNMFLEHAGSDYALQLAKLINADMLMRISPDIITILIDKHTQAAHHIMLLITNKNITAINSSIKAALKEKLGAEWQDHLKKIYAQEKTKKDSQVKEEPKRKLTLLERIGFSNGKGVSNGKK